MVTRTEKQLENFDTKTVGLTYVDDSCPGIHRETSGETVRYRDAHGRIVRTARILTRIQTLAIPPAWTDVWICGQANGHLQATGHDARGRKQYLYHPRWREVRDEAKYEKLVEFAKVLPRIRRNVAADLRRHGLPKKKVLAAIVQIMQLAFIRVGNDEYAKTNGSFGLTTMRDRHAHVQGGQIRFDFRGKSGVKHEIDLKDERLAKIVRQCQHLPGQELFQYRDGRGKVRDITSTDVNQYLHKISGGDFTAKDFRTWAGTSLATQLLLEFETFPSVTAAKRNINQCIAEVARQLGNTKAVCRKSYIHPGVIRCYLDQSLKTTYQRGIRRQRIRARSKLSLAETGVLAVLEQQFVTQTVNSSPRRRRSDQKGVRRTRHSAS